MGQQKKNRTKIEQDSGRQKGKRKKTGEIDDARVRQREVKGGEGEEVRVERETEREITSVLVQRG